MDAFSERFVNALRSRVPELLRHIRQAPTEESIQLRLSAPSGHGELFLATDGEEVTIRFGPWHAHFEENEYWAGGDPPRGEPFERVLDLLADLIRDLVVIRVWTKNGTYAGSELWHWWYHSEACQADCLGDNYSLISWTGRGDLLPPIPVDAEQRRRFFEQLSTGTGPATDVEH